MCVCVRACVREVLLKRQCENILAASKTVFVPKPDVCSCHVSAVQAARADVTNTRQMAASQKTRAAGDSRESKKALKSCLVYVYVPRRLQFITHVCDRPSTLSCVEKPETHARALFVCEVPVAARGCCFLNLVFCTSLRSYPRESFCLVVHFAWTTVSCVCFLCLWRGRKSV